MKMPTQSSGDTQVNLGGGAVPVTLIKDWGRLRTIECSGFWTKGKNSI